MTILLMKMPPGTVPVTLTPDRIDVCPGLSTGLPPRAKITVALRQMDSRWQYPGLWHTLMLATRRQPEDRPAGYLGQA